MLYLARCCFIAPLGAILTQPTTRLPGPHVRPALALRVPIAVVHRHGWRQAVRAGNSHMYVTLPKGSPTDLL